MKLFVEPSQVYLHRDFVDFRKSINGLAVILETDMALLLMSGALFVFCNKGKDKLKILYWDSIVFALCAIVFMYKHIFERELTLLPDTERAKAPKRVPVVLSHTEAMTID